jgi:GNAT superfamily N-acetyltransferase
MPDIIAASSSADYADAAVLFQEYAEWLGIDLSFQGFHDELMDISDMYAPPKGSCWLAYVEKCAIGCIALRPINNQIGELKRMYIKPDHQQQGIGQQLLDAAIQFAWEQGYHSLRLDTLKNMVPAMKLYKKNGFVEIPAYYYNPHPDAIYFEKQLTRLHEK